MRRRWRNKKRQEDNSMDKFTVKQAIKIFALAEGVYTAKEIKAAYRRLSMQYHPDRENGNVELMQAINQAWNVLSLVGDIDTNDYFGDQSPGNDYIDDAILQKLKEAVEALKGFQSPDIEVCGVWLYLHSDLRGDQHQEVRASIKAAGWRWSNKKKTWYYNPEPDNKKRSKRRTGWGFDKIRDTYGSNKYKGSHGDKYLNHA